MQLSYLEIYIYSIIILILVQIINKIVIIIYGLEEKRNISVKRKILGLIPCFTPILNSFLVVFSIAMVVAILLKIIIEQIKGLK
jgi:hypothetical protein